MKAGKIEVTPEMLEKALRCCADNGTERDGTEPCPDCYLFQKNLVKDGQMSTGETCFKYLAMDAIDCIHRLNDFQNSQCAKLLTENGQLKKASELMAQYIVERGHVDDMLCDEIPQLLHLKHQPKNDGNYANGPCIQCVLEYFTQQAQEATNEKLQ